MCVCSLVDCSLPGSSDNGILQTRILEGVATSSSRGSSRPRDQTHVSCVSCTGRWIFSIEPPGMKSSKTTKQSMFSLGKLTITDQQKTNMKNCSTTVTRRVNHFLRPHPSRHHQQASVAYLRWVFASRAILYYFHFTHTMYCSPPLICFSSSFCLIRTMCTEGEWEARTYARKVKTTMRKHFALTKTAIIKKSEDKG